MKKWHRLRISIRTQLISLVLFVAMFSLLILAIVTGVYFTNVLTDTRLSKLQVAAELKGSQMKQSFEYYSYQISLLAAKPSLQTALTYRKAGNTSTDTLLYAKSIMQQTLDASTVLIDAELIDGTLEVVASATNNDSKFNVTDETLQALYVLQSNTTDESDLPKLPNGLLENKGYISGPIIDDDHYFMSLTMPIFANASILVPEILSGFLSVILNVDALSAITNVSGTSDYSSINFFAASHSMDNLTDYTSFYYIFSSSMSTEDEGRLFDFDDFPPAKSVFIMGDESDNHYTGKNPLGESVSLGYSVVDLGYAKWLVTVEQNKSKFMAPTTKLIKIMIGLCIGLAAFMCIVTFPLAHYGVRPIIKLQKATEAITEHRGLKRRKKKIKTSMSPFHNFNEKRRSIDHKLFFFEHDHEDSVDNSNSGFDLAANSNSARNSFTGSSPMSPSSNNSLTDCSNPEVPSSAPLPSVVKTRGIFYDELTELTEAFNAMSLELDRQYAHLEDRVRARTKELEEAKVQADTARQQAEAANEAKTVFIANISHELRTPLNGILGMTSVAMSEHNITKIQSSLELIFRSGELLLHILTQLLTFSKNQLDKSKLQKKNFLMLEVATQINSIFGKSAKDQDVNLVISVKPDLIRKMILYGDSNRIIQVVMNLVSNSLKFTPEDGTVRVVIQVLGEYDENRSKESNYEKVFTKGLECHTDQKPITPVSKVIHNNNVNRINDPKAISDDSSLVSSTTDSDTSSISTLHSSVYHSTLVDSSSSESDKKIEYFNEEEDEFFDDEDIKSSEPNRKFHKCYKFNENKKCWVIRLSVSDTGTGIDQSLQEKIFDAFVQGDQTLSRSHGGTGLGLSICKQFAKMMHGTLTLHSNVGEGSTFTFTIPLPQIGEIELDGGALSTFAKDEFNEKYQKNKKVTFAENDTGSSCDDNKRESMDLAKSYDHDPGSKKDLLDSYYSYSQYEKPDLITRASTGTAYSQRSTKRSDDSSIIFPLTEEDNDDDIDILKSGLRFLVAEDNLVNQEVVKRMLRLEGYRDITLACDGHEAVNIVKDALEHGKAFDLILMDVQMPNMDGLKATRVLREDLHYDKPIVALTAFADKSNEDDCIDAGMSGFLSKPVRRNLLRKSIAQFCDTSKKIHIPSSISSSNRDDSP